eukprot:SAG31_NODE_176_length_21334_cov_12.211067_15_plen_237_part_00
MAAKRKPQITDFFGVGSNGGEMRRRKTTGSRFVECPCCGSNLALHLLDEHLELCLQSQPDAPISAAAARPAAGAPSTCAPKVSPARVASRVPIQRSKERALVLHHPGQFEMRITAAEPTSMQYMACSELNGAGWNRTIIPHNELHGQVLLPEFVSAAEETELLAFLDNPATCANFRLFATHHFSVHSPLADSLEWPTLNLTMSAEELDRSQPIARKQTCFFASATVVFLKTTSFFH